MQELFELKKAKVHLFYNGYEMEEANVLSNYDIQHATFIYMTIEAEEEELYML